MRESDPTHCASLLAEMSEKGRRGERSNEHEAGLIPSRIAHCALLIARWVGGRQARGPRFPGSCPPSTPPALAGGTTGFGMGPGGSPPRSLTPGAPSLTKQCVAEQCAMRGNAPASLLIAHCFSLMQRDTNRRNRGHRSAATWATPTPSRSFAQTGYHRPRPCAPLRSNGCPLSTRGRSTRSSAGGLPCS